MVSLFEILHEDPELLVLRKPAGLVCHPTKGDEYSSLVSRVRIHLGFEPHMIHRLDRETGGVMTFAKTDDAAAELRALWAAGLVTKEYLALVRGRMPAGEGFLDAPLGPEATSAVAIKDCVRPDGASARTRWRCERSFRRAGGDWFSMVRVWLDTGRKHQIRIHLAHLGHPIVGDKIYGGDERIYRLEMPDGDHHADIWLDTPCADLDLAAMKWSGKECPPPGALIDQCDMWPKDGTEREYVQLVSQRKTTWLIVVEGKGAEEGAFALTVQCKPGLH